MHICPGGRVRALWNHRRGRFPVAAMVIPQGFSHVILQGKMETLRLAQSMMLGLMYLVCIYHSCIIHVSKNKKSRMERGHLRDASRLNARVLWCWPSRVDNAMHAWGYAARDVEMSDDRPCIVGYFRSLEAIHRLVRAVR